jgi:hypothetical protein
MRLQNHLEAYKNKCAASISQQIKNILTQKCGQTEIQYSKMPTKTMQIINLNKFPFDDLSPNQ